MLLAERFACAVFVCACGNLDDVGNPTEHEEVACKHLQKTASDSPQIEVVDTDETQADAQDKRSLLVLRACTHDILFLFFFHVAPSLLLPPLYHPNGKHYEDSTSN